MNPGGPRIVIIGAGHAGGSAAALLRQYGWKGPITLIGEESIPPYQRPPLSKAWLKGEADAQSLALRPAGFHAEQRIDLRLGRRAVAIDRAARTVALDTGEALEGAAGRIAGLRLTDGRLISCDIALIGVGGVPNDELARQAGLDCAGGVAVDLAARTSDPAIHAIGDCTIRPLPHYDCMGRPESIPNATEQAKQAAAAICGRPPPAPEVPWFWSDQFELRLQFAGLPFDAAETVIRGDPTKPGFAVFHLNAEGIVQAVETVNAAPEFMAGRVMIARR